MPPMRQTHPTGKSQKSVQPSGKKFSTLPVGQIISTSPRHPASIRGAFRDRHERWVRDAKAAAATPDERRGPRTAKSCGPDAPTLASTRRRCLRIAPGMVARKPGHQGEREGNRKTIAQGRPVFPVNLWWTYSCGFSFPREAAGAAERPAFPAPSTLGDCACKARVDAPRERAPVFALCGLNPQRFSVIWGSVRRDVPRMIFCSPPNGRPLDLVAKTGESSGATAIYQTIKTKLRGNAVLGKDIRWVGRALLKSASGLAL